MAAANGIRMTTSHCQAPAREQSRRNTLVPVVGIQGKSQWTLDSAVAGKERATLAVHQGGSIKKMRPLTGCGVIRESQGTPHVSFIPNDGQ